MIMAYRRFGPGQQDLVFGGEAPPMIPCGFCREVARKKDEYFTSCSKPMFCRLVH